MEIPTDKKVIWLFWDKPLNESPRIVQECVDSWITMNPNWKVVLLSLNNLYEYLPPNSLLPMHKYPNITKFSNHLRLLLLVKHGGVWADATTFCHQSLDSWLGSAAKRGLFMFSDPQRDRPIANWFIANLNPDSSGYALGLLERRYRNYFEKNQFRNSKVATKIAEDINHLMQKAEAIGVTPELKARFWSSSFATKILRLTPYFYFHYLVTLLTKSDTNFQEEISTMKYISAKKSFTLSNALKPIDPKPLPPNFEASEILVTKFSSRKMPMKLGWNSGDSAIN